MLDTPTVPAIRYNGPGGEYIVRRSSRAMIHQSAIIAARQLGHYAEVTEIDAPTTTEFYTG